MQSGEFACHKRSVVSRDLVNIVDLRSARRTDLLLIADGTWRWYSTQWWHLLQCIAVSRELAPLKIYDTKFRRFSECPAYSPRSEVHSVTNVNISTSFKGNAVVLGVAFSKFHDKLYLRYDELHASVNHGIMRRRFKKMDDETWPGVAAFNELFFSVFTSSQCNICVEKTYKPIMFLY